MEDGFGGSGSEVDDFPEEGDRIRHEGGWGGRG